MAPNQKSHHSISVSNPESAFHLKYLTELNIYSAIKGVIINV